MPILKQNSRAAIEREWRKALVEAESVRQRYLQELHSEERDESELERLWLQLWAAERRRESLYHQIV